MAFFTAIGTISNDIVRRETKNGVVATFRLETGAPRGRKLWIDIECWGHLAGTVTRFGSRGRVLACSGLIVESAWREHTGIRRVRVSVLATTAALLDKGLGAPQLLHSASVLGRVDGSPQVRTIRSGCETHLQLQVDKVASHNPLRQLRVIGWSPPTAAPPSIDAGTRLTVVGCLVHDPENRSYVLRAHTTAPALARQQKQRGRG